MDLYTVHLRRKQIISTYDAEGTASETKELLLDTTYSGCPPQLVNTYKRDFPDAFVSATRDVPEPQRHGGGKARVTDGAENRQRRRVAASEHDHAPIYGDDYAEALSRAAAREAA